MNLHQNIDYKELYCRFSRLFSGLVNDSLREMNYLYQALPPNILPLRDEMIVAGPAFTVRSVKEATTDFVSIDIRSRMAYRAEILKEMYEGCVVVWDTDEDQICAVWGAMMTRMAKRQGCTGAVIDGGIRDTKDILKQDFSVFYRFRTTNGVLGRQRWLEYQTPIRFGSLIVTPGDYVFGDIDGVVIIPKSLILPVLERAEKKAQDELCMEEWIRKGESADEIVEKGGIF